MPVEVTDVQATVETPAPETPEAAPAEEAEGAAEEEPVVATPAPKKRGGPAGAKDKAPRKKPIVGEEIQETPKRNEKTLKKVPKRVVTAVVGDPESDESDEEPEEPQYVPPPPSLRTQQRERWKQHRQQQVQAHQQRSQHFANIFDKMLGY